MPNNSTQNKNGTTSSFFNFIKDLRMWFPILVAIGGVVVGYYVFKAETKHQFDIQSKEIKLLTEGIKGLKESQKSFENGWRKDVEKRINELREENIRQELRIQWLERHNTSSASSEITLPQ